MPIDKPSGPFGVAMLVGIGLVGCASLLGDFEIGDASANDDGSMSDARGPPDDGAASGAADSRVSDALTYANVDAASDVLDALDARPDAPTVDAPESDACTPFPPQVATTDCQGNVSRIPENFLVTLVNQGCGGKTTGTLLLAQATPAQCRCRETYTCDCLTQHGGCSGHVYGCSTNADQELVVQCQ